MPINDKDMIFDESINKYVITYTGVESRLFIDENILNLFSGDDTFEKFSQEMSEDIYLYVLRHKFVAQRKYWLAEMNENEEYRPFIKNALLAQIRYAVRSGGNLLKDMHGIDIERARFIDINRMRGDIGISPNAIEELKNGGLLSTQPYRYL